MNETVIEICKKMQKEAQSVIDYTEGCKNLVASGEAASIKSVEMFRELSIDCVEHCQKLLVALSNCFFQNVTDKKEGT